MEWWLFAFGYSLSGLVVAAITLSFGFFEIHSDLLPNPMLAFMIWGLWPLAIPWLVCEGVSYLHDKITTEET